MAKRVFLVFHEATKIFFLHLKDRRSPCISRMISHNSPIFFSFFKKRQRDVKGHTWFIPEIDFSPQDILDILLVFRDNGLSVGSTTAVFFPFFFPPETGDNFTLYRSKFFLYLKNLPTKKRIAHDYLLPL